MLFEQPSLLFLVLTLSNNIVQCYDVVRPQYI
jgi:hypothetical protein